VLLAETAFLPLLLLSQDLSTQSEQAAELLKSGRAAEAAVIYERLVRAMPSNAGLHLNLGLARFQAGDYQRATAVLDRAVRLDPKLNPAWLVLGLCYRKLGQPAHAIGPLERATRMDPGNPIARLELADAYLSTGQPAKAIEHFTELARMEPGRPKAWQGLVLAHAAASRRAFEELEKLAPESEYWYALLGRSRLEQGQFRSAYYFFRQALARQRDFPEMHLAIAEVYRRTGHSDWADIEAAHASSTSPLPAAAAAAIYRRALEHSRQSAEALARLEGLPPSAEQYELRAEAHSLRGEHRAAATAWEEALKLTPGDRRFLLGLARSLWRNLQCAEATAILDRLASEQAEAAHIRGDCLLQDQQPEKAVPLLEKAVRFDPSLLPARASLARALQRLGRDPDAVPHFEAALAIDEDGSLHLQLSRAYERTGKKELAAKRRARFQAITESRREKARRASEEFQIGPP
jgi:tetratricopeptide (TPR) repeat protein